MSSSVQGTGRLLLMSNFVQVQFISATRFCDAWSAGRKGGGKTSSCMECGASGTKSTMEIQANESIAHPSARQSFRQTNKSPSTISVSDSVSFITPRELDRPERLTLSSVSATIETLAYCVYAHTGVCLDDRCWIEKRAVSAMLAAEGMGRRHVYGESSPYDGTDYDSDDGSHYYGDGGEESDDLEQWLLMLGGHLINSLLLHFHVGLFRCVCYLALSIGYAGNCFVHKCGHRRGPLENVE